MTHAPALIHLMAGGLTFAMLCAIPSAAGAQTPQTPEQGPPPLPKTATEPQGFIAEPDIVYRAALFGDRHLASGGSSNGFYVETGNMITGAGWVSFGPGFRHWFSNDRAVFDTSAAISWRGYRTAQARFELPHLARSRLALGSEVRYQDYTQVSHYGNGPDSLETHRGEYRFRGKNVVGYATLKPVQWLSVGTQVGWLKPEILPRSGAFMRSLPNVFELFPRDPVFGFGEQPAFVQTEASITADTRDFPGHPLRGVLLRVVAANYDDRDTGFFSFRRYESEAAGFIPLAGSRIVLALRGWLVASETGDGHVVPFYFAPSLGGSNTLRGYGDYRFHDRNMMVVNVETRVAMMTHVDAAFFVDAGNVAPRVGDLNLDRRSYGLGLRLHSRRETFARVDAARGSEGWRFLFRLNDPLNLSRLLRRATPAPFVP